MDSTESNTRATSQCLQDEQPVSTSNSQRNPTTMLPPHSCGPQIPEIEHKAFESTNVQHFENQTDAIHVFRQQLRRKLEKQIEQARSEKGREQALKAARCIERFLFEQTSNDISDIKERLAIWHCCLMQRKVAQKPADGTTAPKEIRQLLLRRLLGSTELYRHACLLTREIEKTRLQHVAAGCSQCVNNNVCGKQPAMSGTLPPAVKNLFFNVDLLYAMEVMPLEELKKVTHDQWTLWINGAIKILEDYQQWKNKILR